MFYNKQKKKKRVITELHKSPTKFIGNIGDMMVELKVAEQNSQRNLQICPLYVFDMIYWWIRVCVISHTASRDKIQQHPNKQSKHFTLTMAIAQELKNRSKQKSNSKISHIYSMLNDFLNTHVHREKPACIHPSIL